MTIHFSGAPRTHIKFPLPSIHIGIKFKEIYSCANSPTIATDISLHLFISKSGLKLLEKYVTR